MLICPFRPAANDSMMSLPHSLFSKQSERLSIRRCCHNIWSRFKPKVRHAMSGCRAAKRVFVPPIPLLFFQTTIFLWRYIFPRDCKLVEWWLPTILLQHVHAKVKNDDWNDLTSNLCWWNVWLRNKSHWQLGIVLCPCHAPLSTCSFANLYLRDCCCQVLPREG